MNTIKTILFVENDPVALEMYRNRLQREGFRVESALDGLEALKVLSQTTPDIAVLDSTLPKLSGTDVLKYIRDNSPTQNLPVALFCSSSESEDETPLAGPTRRLLKTDCTFAMLLRTIHEMLAAGNTTATAATTLQPVFAPAQSEPQSAQDEFLARAQTETPKIREHCFAYIKSPASPASLQHLPSLHQRIHFLSTNAGNVGFARLALLTNAFDTLLSEIIAKPSWVTPSILQTIAQAVDCLGYLLKSNSNDLAQPMPQAKVLAVDDDAVCNHVIVNTLKRAGFDAKSASDPLVALQLLESGRYDLILLDISMPGMTGFELCEKLRGFPHAKTTPVIFITGHNNFDNRKQSVLSGGHDFITKPVSPSELALKATIHVLRSRIQRGSAQNTDSSLNPKPTRAGTETTALAASHSQPEQFNPGILSGSAGSTSNSLRPPNASDLPRATSVDPNEVAAAAAAFLATTESGNTGSPLPTWTQENSPAALSASAPAESAAHSLLAPVASQHDNIEIKIGGANPVYAPGSLVPANPAASVGFQPTGILESPSVGHSALAEPAFDPLSGHPLSREGFDGSSNGGPPDTGNTPSEPWSLSPASTDDPGSVPFSMPGAASAERIASLEHELSLLRQEHSEAQTKLASQQQADHATQQELSDLRNRLSQATTDLDQAKASHEHHASEHSRVEAEWRDQLNSAQAANAQSQSQLKERESHAAQLQEQLEGLQREHNEAQNKLSSNEQTEQTARKEISDLRDRLGQLTSELDQAKAGHEQLTSERARLESDWHNQFDAAQAATAQSQSQLREKESHAAQLQQQLAALQSEHNEAKNRIASQQQSDQAAQSELFNLRHRLGQVSSELDQAKGSHEQFASERARLESDLREQLDAAQAATAQAQSQFQDKESNAAQLQQRLAALQSEHNEAQTRLASQQQTNQAAQKELSDLRSRLSQLTSELDHAKAGHQQLTSERARLESDLRNQLHAAQAATDQARSQLKEKEGHAAQLQQQLAALQSEHNEAQNKLASHLQSEPIAQQELSDLRTRLSRVTSELEQAKAGHQQLSSEREGIESELRNQLNSAHAATAQSQYQLQEKQDHAAQLQQQLAALQSEHSEARNRLASQQQADQAAQQELSQLRNRLGQLTSELVQARTGGEQLASERARLESDLRNQINAAESVAAQLQQQLGGLQSEHTEAQNRIASQQQADHAAQQELSNLGSRLAQVTSELEQARAALNQHVEDRARLEGEHRALAEAKEALDLELAREREYRLGHARQSHEKHRKMVEALRENIQELHSSLTQDSPSPGETDPS